MVFCLSVLTLFITYLYKVANRVFGSTMRVARLKRQYKQRSIHKPNEKPYDAIGHKILQSVGRRLRVKVLDDWYSVTQRTIAKAANPLIR
jgi:hypothetical protein